MSEVFFDPAVGGDGSTVSDDGNPATGLANSGHRTRFVPALAQIVAVAAHVVLKAQLAADKASAAEGFASDASGFKNAAEDAATLAAEINDAVVLLAAAAESSAAAAAASAAAVDFPAPSVAAQNKVIAVNALGQWVLKLLSATDVGAEPTISAGTANDYIAGNKTIRDFGANVRMTVLTGLSTASAAAITAVDSALAAFGKLQAQLNDKQTQINGKQAALVSGSNIKTIGGVSPLGGGNIGVLTSDFGHGNVGSLALILRNASTEIPAGTVVSSAEYAVIGGGYASPTSGGSAPGSWRLLGKAPAFSPNPVAVLAQRIA
ncbi:hypothetical protein [Azonexus sp.]|uniref:hypothetical protein n=1 Tax=Azonexus sp. TaxID=1872668 RepID=UPI0027B9CC7D|nr:hypothetical protein [Azonexus sp.]